MKTSTVVTLTKLNFTDVRATVELMRETQEMQIKAKVNQLDSYGGAEFDKLLKELTKSAITEVELATKFMVENNCIESN